MLALKIKKKIILIYFKVINIFLKIRYIISQPSNNFIMVSVSWRDYIAWRVVNLGCCDDMR